VIFIRSGEPQDHENSVVNKVLEFFSILTSLVWLMMADTLHTGEWTDGMFVAEVYLW